MKAEPTNWLFFIGAKIEKGITNIEIKGLQKGRVRSRDPMEKEILNRFKR